MNAITDRQVNEADKLIAALQRRVGDMSSAQARVDLRAARPKTRQRMVRHFKKGRNPAELDEFLGE